MRKCSACQRMLSDISFSRRRVADFQSKCRKCQAIYSRQHYLKNKARYIAQSVARVKKHRAKLLVFLKAYLLEHPCVDCNDERLPVLEFDHVRGKKRLSVSRMVHNGYSLKTIKAEIAKCDVRCANCHRMRTTQKTWWRAGR